MKTKKIFCEQTSPNLSSLRSEDKLISEINNLRKVFPRRRMRSRCQMMTNVCDILRESCERLDELNFFVNKKLYIAF